MNRAVYRYQFTPDLPLDEVEATLLLSLFAVESLHGEAQTKMDAAHCFDGKKRACVLDGSTEVGRALARIFTGLLTREFGAASFQVERVEDARSRASQPAAA